MVTLKISFMRKENVQDMRNSVREKSIPLFWSKLMCKHFDHLACTRSFKTVSIRYVCECVRACVHACVLCRLEQQLESYSAAAEAIKVHVDSQT